MATNGINDFVSCLKMKCDLKRWDANYSDKDLRMKPNDPVNFQVTCQVFGTGNDVKGIGTGRTKKQAKHLAAKDALVQLGFLPADENAGDPSPNQTTHGDVAQDQVSKPVFLENLNRDNSAKSVSEGEVTVADANAFCSVVGEPASPKKPRLDTADVPRETSHGVAQVLETNLGDQQKRPVVLVNMVSSTTKAELMMEHGRAEPRKNIECNSRREWCKKQVSHLHHRFLDLVVNEYIPENTRFETLSEVDKTLKLLALQNDDCFSHKYKNAPSKKEGAFYSFCYLEYDPKGKVGGDKSCFLGEGISFDDAQRAAGEAAIRFLQGVSNE